MAAVWNGGNTPTPTIILTPRGRMFVYDLGGATVGVSDEVSLQVPAAFTLTSLIVTMPTPGSASTVQPKLGTAAGFTANSADNIANIAAAAAHCHEQTAVKGYSAAGTLIVRPTPDATCTTMRIQACVLEGHL